MGRSGRGDGGSELGWHTLEETMRAIEEHHGVKTTIVVTREPSRAALLQVVVSAIQMPSLQRPVIGIEQLVIAAQETYLAGGHGEFAPFVYRLLIDLDRECDKALWRQQELPLVDPSPPKGE